MMSRLLADVPRNASHSASFDDAMAAMRVCDVVCFCDRPKFFDTIPDFCERVRGALGRALGRIGEQEGQRDYRLLHAAVVGPTSTGFSNAPYIRGYSTWFREQGSGIRVGLRLFGVMSNFWEPAARSLTEALEGGIAIRHQSKHRIAFQVERLECIWHGSGRARASEGTAPEHDVKVELLTPLSIRSEGRVPEAIGTLPLNIFNRAVGLARWSSLQVSSSFQDLGCRGELTEVDVTRHLWRHYSSRTPVGGRETIGVTGFLNFTDCNDAMLNLLQLAELTGVGGGATAGFGQVRVMPSLATTMLSKRHVGVI